MVLYDRLSNAIPGAGLLEGAILRTMSLSPGSDRLQTWLNPPVQPALTAYAFHVTNPEAVMQGKKPVLEEIGPFTYKAVNIKDSLNQTGEENLQFNEDGETLTYRLRFEIIENLMKNILFLLTAGKYTSWTLIRALVTLTPPSSPSPTSLSSPVSPRSVTWTGARPRLSVLSRTLGLELLSLMFLFLGCCGDTMMSFLV